MLDYGSRVDNHLEQKDRGSFVAMVRYIYVRVIVTHKRIALRIYWLEIVGDPVLIIYKHAQTCRHHPSICVRINACTTHHS